MHTDLIYASRTASSTKSRTSSPFRRARGHRPRNGRNQVLCPRNNPKALCPVKTHDCQSTRWLEIFIKSLNISLLFSSNYLALCSINWSVSSSKTRGSAIRLKCFLWSLMIMTALFLSTFYESSSWSCKFFRMERNMEQNDSMHFVFSCMACMLCLLILS